MTEHTAKSITHLTVGTCGRCHKPVRIGEPKGRDTRTLEWVHLTCPTVTLREPEPPSAA
jgi:hypothetical protein